MYFLGVEISSTDAVQAIAAVVSAWIAFLVFQQGKKIKELAEIVKELKQSNTTLERRFQLEKNAQLSALIPILRSGDKIVRDPSNVELIFTNVGSEAKKIETDQSNDDLFIVDLVEHSAATNNSVHINVFMKDKSPLENVRFNIILTSLNGLKCKQQITKMPGHDFQIGIPESDI